jgi:hypothetical protein
VAPRQCCATSARPTYFKLKYVVAPGKVTDHAFGNRDFVWWVYFDFFGTGVARDRKSCPVVAIFWAAQCARPTSANKDAGDYESQYVNCDNAANDVKLI